MSQEIVLITGSSSGFGYGAVLELAKRDFKVIATMRNKDHGVKLIENAARISIPTKNITIKQLDVTKEEQIDDIYNDIIESYGHIDILINNAGYSQAGFIEEIDMKLWEEQFQTNVFGLIALTKKFIPMMRNARKGKIINLGSISGRIGLPCLGAYATSKYAIAGFTEALRLELIPFHVYTSLIEAGSFQTNIWEKALNSVVMTKNKDYEKVATYLERYATKKQKSAENPEKVIELIARICETSKPRFRYQIGKGVKTTIALKSFVPWVVAEQIINKLLINHFYQNK